MNTIKEAVEILQKSVSAALPGMVVSVNISLSPGVVEKNNPVTIPDEMPADLAKEIDISALRSFLNAFASKAGKTKAKAMVRKYTGSESIDPKDIPVEKYETLIKEVSTQYPKIELSFKEKEAA